MKIAETDRAFLAAEARALAERMADPDISNAYEERLRLIFFIAAAGRMTSAPTRTVPTILIPTATTAVTRNK